MYLVVVPHGLFKATTDRADAETTAGYVDAVVAAVPIVADYRKHDQTGEQDG